MSKIPLDSQNNHKIQTKKSIVGALNAFKFMKSIPDPYHNNIKAQKQTQQQQNQNEIALQSAQGKQPLNINKFNQPPSETSNQHPMNDKAKDQGQLISENKDQGQPIIQNKLNLAQGQEQIMKEAVDQSNITNLPNPPKQQISAQVQIRSQEKSPSDLLSQKKKQILQKLIRLKQQNKPCILSSISEQGDQNYIKKLIEHIQKKEQENQNIFNKNSQTQQNTEENRRKQESFKDETRIQATTFANIEQNNNLKAIQVKRAYPDDKQIQEQVDMLAKVVQDHYKAKSAITDKIGSQQNPEEQLQHLISVWSQLQRRNAELEAGLEKSMRDNQAKLRTSQGLRQKQLSSNRQTVRAAGVDHNHMGFELNHLKRLKQQQLQDLRGQSQRMREKYKNTQDMLKKISPYVKRTQGCSSIIMKSKIME